MAIKRLGRILNKCDNGLRVCAHYRDTPGSLQVHSRSGKIFLRVIQWEHAHCTVKVRSRSTHGCFLLEVERGTLAVLTGGGAWDTSVSLGACISFHIIIQSQI